LRILILYPNLSMPFIWDELGAMGARATIVHAPNKQIPAELPFPHDDVALDINGDPEAAMRALEDLHRRERYDVVFTASEMCVLFCAQLAKNVGLRGIEPRTALLARDKAQMRAAFRDAGLNTPAFTLGPSADGTLPPHMRFPVVAKPISGFGSQGVARANDEAELRAALQVIREINQDSLDKLSDAKVGHFSGILVEEYIEGKEYAIDCFMQAGKAYVMCTCEKPDLVGPYFEEWSYVAPARLDEATMTRMLEEAAGGALALGLVDGAVHAEVRIRDGVPYLIEIGARIGGTGLAQFFTEVTTGVHFVRLVIDNLRGGAEVSGLPFAPSPRNAAAAFIPQVGGGGTVAAFEGLDAVRQKPEVVHVAEFLKAGDVIPAWPKFNFYPAFVCSRHGSVEAAVAFQEWLKETMRIRYESAAQPV
jgi:biotin carboxylase